MAKPKQKETAKKLNISESYLSEIVNGRRRPSYKLAKRMAAFFGTSVLLFMDGSADDIRAAVHSAAQPEKVAA